MAFVKNGSHPLLEPFAKRECSRCFTVLFGSSRWNSFLEAQGFGGTALQLSVRSQHWDCSAIAACVYLFPLAEYIQMVIQLITTQLSVVGSLLIESTLHAPGMVPPGTLKQEWKENREKP